MPVIVTKEESVDGFFHITYKYNEFPQGLNADTFIFTIKNMKEALSTILKSWKKTQIDASNGEIELVFFHNFLNTVNPTTNKTDFEALDEIVHGHLPVYYLAPSVTITENRDNSGNVKFVLEPRDSGVQWNITSHNFCDRTTWFTNAIEAQETIVVNNADMGLSHQNIIELNQGKILREEVYQNYYKSLEIKHNDDVVPYDILDNQAEIVLDAKLGVLKNLQNRVGQTLNLTYLYATNSVWSYKPFQAKIRLEYAEIQVSEDFELNDTLIVEAFSNNDVNQLIKGFRLEYKTMYQIIDEVKGGGERIPAIGGTKRGLMNPIVIFKILFIETLTLDSEKQDQIRIRTKSNNAFNGERATITFYGSQLT